MSTQFFMWLNCAASLSTCTSSFLLYGVNVENQRICFLQKRPLWPFFPDLFQHFSRSNAILVDAIPHAEVTKRTDKTYAMQAESVVDETLVSMSLPPSCNRQNQTGYTIFAQKNESRRGGLLNPSKDSRLRRQNTKKKRKIWLKTLLVLSLTSNILL